MKLLEMRARGEKDLTLAASAARVFSRKTGKKIEVIQSARRKNECQNWLVQSLFSAYFTPEISSEALFFLAEAFRWDYWGWKTIPRALVVTLLADRHLIRNIGRHGFSIRPGLNNADGILIVPGNQRVRVFNFTSGIVTVQLKDNFKKDSLERELSTRIKHSDCPAPQILDYGDNHVWFEEPILNGWSLPRCPPWIKREDAEQNAFYALETWLKKSKRSVNGSDYILNIESTIREKINRCSTVGLSTDKIDRIITLLVRLALNSSEVEIALSHGDFQPGNIFVRRGTRSVLILDWEHSHERQINYDFLVYNLRSRAPDGLSKRVRDFVENGTYAADNKSWLTKKSRIVQIACFLLEELAWRIEEAFSCHNQLIATGLRRYIVELNSIASRLH